MCSRAELNLKSRELFPLRLFLVPLDLTQYILCLYLGHQGNSGQAADQTVHQRHTRRQQKVSTCTSVEDPDQIASEPCCPGTGAVSTDLNDTQVFAIYCHIPKFS